MAMYNKTLGKFQLVGIPPAPRGMPQIEVAFDIDANGIINVSAKDLGTGNEQQIKIEGGSGLKEDEVQRMIKDAEAHADEAHKLRELADARNQAEALAYQTEKSLKEHRDKLDESVASTVEGRIMELRGVLESSDVAEIKAKTRRAPGGVDGGGLGDLRAGLGVDAAPAATAGAGSGRRGDRGRRLRGRRRGGGQDLVTTSENVRERSEDGREAPAEPPRTRRRTPVEDVDELAQVDARARRVPRRAPAAEGRVRQLPQAGRARPGATWSRAPPSGS